MYSDFKIQYRHKIALICASAYDEDDLAGKEVGTRYFGVCDVICACNECASLQSGLGPAGSPSHRLSE